MPPQLESGLAGDTGRTGGMVAALATAVPASPRPRHRTGTTGGRAAASSRLISWGHRRTAGFRERAARAGAARGGPRSRRMTMSLPVVIVILVGANVGLKFGPPNTGLVLGPGAAAALLALARWSGMSWSDLGLGRRSLRKGLAYAAVAVGAVGLVYVAGALFPPTRAAFLDARYQLAPGSALATAFVVIPLGTVLLEEIAFRGVLLGLADHHLGMPWAAGLSSALFGLWHILPSLRLGTANKAVQSVAGSGPGAEILVVSGAVAFTALAGLLFCELRRRSGSVLASAGLHWATNGLGVLLAALLWRVGTA